LHSFSNVSQWVGKLDEQIENLLSKRLVYAVEAWRDVLTGKRSEYEDENLEELSDHVKIGGEGFWFLIIVNLQIDSKRRLRWLYSLPYSGLETCSTGRSSIDLYMSIG